ncbi:MULTISPECIES: Gmad2 immunoglobulin-like domain-containing protein [unclassified Nocardioides]|uniref:Gmad2 immunoglobulin-like domain-containing protein n=1 Tax=unclassified Nocardioides TaxID=2615069 RepID=UPI0030157260
MDDLHALLDDAVADVEPADRLGEIRARTRRPARRPGRYAVGAAVLATAATVATVATVVVVTDGPASDPEVAAGPDPSVLVPVYFVGETPRGARLFREFDRVPGDDRGAAALALLQAEPSDPDYRTAWQPGSLLDVTLTNGTIVVRLGTGAPGGADGDLSVQQVVHTVQAALQSRAPVQLVLRDGDLVDRPVTARPALDVLSHVNISDPTEGRVVSGSFTARGVASSPEATVPWELRRGDEVVRDGFATAEGWLDRLYPWETTVDVSGLEPGEYTFVTRTADESGGEGPGPDVDTRTVVVE